MRAARYFPLGALYVSRSQLVSIAATLAAFIYALIVVWTPWEALMGAAYIDRAVFLANLEVPPVWVIFPDASWAAFVLAEPLWDVIVRLISVFSGDYSVSLSMVTFFTAFVISRFVLVRYTSVVAFIMLFNVLLIDLVSSQLRSALALSLALILYHRGARLLRSVALLAVTLIH